WSLGGTICAPGGTTCATAANETLTIAKAAAMARTHASMTSTLDERAEILRYGETRSQRRQLSCFGNSSRCFKKVTPASRDAAGSWLPRPGDSGAAANSRRPLAVWCRCLSALVADRASEAGLRTDVFEGPRI